MKSKIVSVLVVSCMAMLAACSSVDQAYWQRVEDNSALYMTGPKAQQRLDENISTCVNEIDELVKLDALSEGALPSDYQIALKKSGDLASYDRPTTLGNKKVAHSDFHDYESCMRSKGWERVKYVRYQTASAAKETFKETQKQRKNGGTTFGSWTLVE